MSWFSNLFNSNSVVKEPVVKELLPPEMIEVGRANITVHSKEHGDYKCFVNGYYHSYLQYESSAEKQFECWMYRNGKRCMVYVGHGTWVPLNDVFITVEYSLYQVERK